MATFPVYDPSLISLQSHDEYPYRVLSDDDSDLPEEIPDGPRCSCSAGCLKLLEFLTDLEASNGHCYSCCDADVGCLCECMGCERQKSMQPLATDTPISSRRSKRLPSWVPSLHSISEEESDWDQHVLCDPDDGQPRKNKAKKQQGYTTGFFMLTHPEDGRVMAIERQLEPEDNGVEKKCLKNVVAFDNQSDCFIHDRACSTQPELKKDVALRGKDS